MNSIARFQQIIDNIKQQLGEQISHPAKLSSSKLKKNEQVIFQHNSGNWQQFITESEQTLSLLKSHINNPAHDAQCQHLVEKLDAQLNLLIKALKAKDVLNQSWPQFNRQKAKQKNTHKTPVRNMPFSGQNLYLSLSEHLEYERRLQVMIDERCTARASASGAALTQLNAEILKLHQRIGRCRQAISKIEREIERFEKRQ